MRQFIFEQQLPNFAILRTRERNQTRIVLVEQPISGDLRMVALIVDHIRARDQITQAQVTGFILNQQQHPMRRFFVIWIDDLHIRTQNWLDALVSGFFIKLNQAKSIHQIGHRQRALRIIARFSDRIAHANNPIGDGKLGVHAQMDELRLGHGVCSEVFDINTAIKYITIG